MLPEDSDLAFSGEFPLDSSLGGNLLEVLPFPRIHLVVIAERFAGESGQVFRNRELHFRRILQPHLNLRFSNILHSHLSMLSAVR